MKWRMKKRNALIAIACMSMVIVSGCSGGTKSGVTTTATPGVSQIPDEGAKKDVEKIYIYAGGAIGNASTLSKTEDYELVRQKIIEESGIEIVPIIPPKGQEVEKLNLLLSSNEPLDIFIENTVNYRNNGAILPLNDLLDQYGSNVRALWPEEWKDSWQSLTDNSGKIWGIPTVPGLAMKATFLRTDWMKQLNLDMPNTLDELEEVLKTFKEKDPAGNGKTIPMVTNLVGLNLGIAAGFMDVGYGPFVDADGKVKPIVMHEGYRIFVEKIADWYKKGYIYKETFSLDRERLRDLVRQNRVASAVVHDTDVLAIQFELKRMCQMRNTSSLGQ